MKLLSARAIEVEGLAPTSRAAQKLAEAGMETETLQRHLARGEQPDDGQKRLYVVDESSMASTKQMHTFVERLKENDRVLFVGDVRQHEAVEAGRPYAQLQEAGLRTASWMRSSGRKTRRSKRPSSSLRAAKCARPSAISTARAACTRSATGRSASAEIAREYVRSPEKTLGRLARQ